MLDILVQEFVFDLVFELFDGIHIAVGSHDQVGRQGVLRRADGPDMDMVEIYYSVDLIDRLPDLF